MKSLARLRSTVEHALILGLVPAFVACGSSEPNNNQPEPPPAADAGTNPPPTGEMPDSGQPGTPDSGQPPIGDPSVSDWKTLLTGDWTMAPGTEGYICVRKTLEEDTFVKVFDAINPPGTHHTLLTIGEPDAPDGTAPCGAGTNRTQSVFGSGVGNVPLTFPKDVAFKMKKGQQLLLNLHLFNTTASPINGTSGTKFKTIVDAPVQAEGLLAGTIRLDLPPAATTTSIGYCTMSIDSTLFAVSQHMHVLGVHEKMVLERASGGEQLLFDGPYNFEEQRYYEITPVEVKKGDKVRVECTHNNTTANRVTFGESTLQEMCFAGLYRYPADGSNFMCIK
ncbi:MAG: hypothetical protein ABW133_15710 [Polyangiaceae bacterium]